MEFGVSDVVSLHRTLEEPRGDDGSTETGGGVASTGGIGFGGGGGSGMGDQDQNEGEGDRDQDEGDQGTDTDEDGENPGVDSRQTMEILIEHPAGRSFTLVVQASTLFC